MRRALLCAILCAGSASIARADDGARFRLGLWLGNLSPGLFSTIGANPGTTGAGDSIGHGSGLVMELGAQATIGDWDFAFGFLTDQLIDLATEDVDDFVARQALRLILGELKSRALEALIGREISVAVRSGTFSGPYDGSQFGFRNNVVSFAPKNAEWESDYFAVQLGMQFASSYSSHLYLRYSHFTSPQLIEVLGTMPVGLNDTVVDAVGLGFQFKGDAELSGPFRVFVDVSMVPFTGLARLDYGKWGALFGALFEVEGSIDVAYEIELGAGVRLAPYLGFRVDMLSPPSGSFTTDLGNVPGFLAPDYLLWGPMAGLEVVL